MPSRILADDIAEEGIPIPSPTAKYVEDCSWADLLGVAIDETLDSQMQIVAREVEIDSQPSTSQGKKAT